MSGTPALIDHAERHFKTFTASSFAYARASASCTHGSSSMRRPAGVVAVSAHVHTSSSNRSASPGAASVMRS
jgi:hypothetical protein